MSLNQFQKDLSLLTSEDPRTSTLKLLTTLKSLISENITREQIEKALGHKVSQFSSTRYNQYPVKEFFGNLPIILNKLLPSESSKFCVRLNFIDANDWHSEF